MTWISNYMTYCETEDGVKNKFIWAALGLWVLAAGCAHVQVDAPKDPIKMDISMRLDVYQHVAKDADDIENLVSGSAAKSKKAELSSLILPSAYADEEEWTPEAKDAAYRRRDRRTELNTFESQGILGESNNALVVSRSAGNERSQQVMNEENSDRNIIYQSIAKKRQTSVADVQKVYAERLRGRLASGTPVQNADGSWTTQG